MWAAIPAGPDWTEAAAYAPLLRADRSLFAWEWLRRDPAYRAAARDALCPAPGTKASLEASENFGLVSFEDPRLAVPCARPLWSSQIHPYVLWVQRGRSSGPEDRFDQERLAGLVRRIRAAKRDHLLLCDGLRTIRLDGPAGLFGGAACLDYVIGGLSSARPLVLALGRFLALVRTGRFSGVLHPREAKARRWILMLRAWDAIQAGASQRDIARVLISASAGGRGWRASEPSLRSRVQRLVRCARQQADGDYRLLLR